MAYQVYWSIPQEVLCLEMDGDVTITDFHQINEAILTHLGDKTLGQNVVLLVDITQTCRIPQVYTQLAASQTYTRRYDLKMIAVVTTDKLMRLMMLLTFNLCKPSLKFFDNVDYALEFVQKVS